MEKIYKTGEFAKRINSKFRTVINWDNKGIIKAQRTITGRRFYTEAQALEYLGIKKSTSDKKNIIYCRVSTKNQRNDLVNQENYIISYCKSNGLTFDDVIKDFGSGLNYKRKGFNEILKRVENREINTIFVTHKDRFIRFGFNWFETFCNQHECNIVILNKSEKDINTELVEDLISIIHVFSCRLYGLRNYKRKTKLEKIVEKELNANTQNKNISK